MQKQRILFRLLRSPSMILLLSCGFLAFGTSGCKAPEVYSVPTLALPGVCCKGQRGLHPPAGTRRMLSDVLVSVGTTSAACDGSDLRVSNISTGNDLEASARIPVCGDSAVRLFLLD